MDFRLLRADEIDVKVKQITKTSIMLLLYKDARCDQNILDESVGAMNWQRHHSRDNANCIVSIWDADKKVWVEKEDTGTESFTEKEKGLASDSFKRACFNWGIGRELYTSPRMFFPKSKCNISGDKCYDKFAVDAITYIDDSKVIESVVVKNLDTGEVMTFSNKAPKSPSKSKKITKAQAKAMADRLEKANVNIEAMCQRYGESKLEDLTEEDYDSMDKWLSSKGV